MLLPLASFLLFFLFISSPSLLAAGPVQIFDHSEWDQFLKEFVNKKGEVDYRAAQKKPEHLLNYLKKIKSIPEEPLKEWPREERIAILINAYNAAVVKSILDHYPIKSIMEIPGVWDNVVVFIGTSIQTQKPRAHSLNQIRTDLLMQKFRDEKILFALCSGAKGSPPLQREAYGAPRLEGQLYLVTRKFANDEASNQIDPARKRVVLSRVFKWYGPDFLLNWGDIPDQPRWHVEEKAVLNFFAHYLEDPKKAEFLKEGTYKVKYESFDWRLNDASQPVGQRA